jgi:glycerol-3-phosphate acyltransferase PlsY
LPGVFEIIVIAGSYFLGCVVTGYYLVRFRTGEDIRDLGSGSAGAKNAGRKLGTPGFAITFIGDFAKGIVAVLAAGYLGLELWMKLLAVLAVVAGHIWPVQLGFRGGKGIATALGALLIYDYLIILPILIIYTIVFRITRKFTMSGLYTIALTPPVLFAVHIDSVTSIGVTILALIILVAHRKNIRDEYARVFARSGIKEQV